MSALESVGIVLAREGEFDGALKLVRESSLGDFESWPERDKVLTEVVLGLGRRGQTERALEIAHRINKPEQKAKALSRASSELARAGDFDGASQAGGAIEDESWKGAALTEVASRVAEAGDIRYALAQARDIRHAGWRSVALAHVARSLADRADRAQATECVDEALTVARGIGDEAARAATLCSVIAVLPVAIEANDVFTALYEAFTTARRAGRDFVFHSLYSGTRLLASVDGGETLWRTYRAVMDVEAWWAG